jgi:predicted phage terminase large subunit-like protein
MTRLKNGMFLVDDVKRGQWGSAERERIIRQTAEADGKKVFIVVEQEPGSGGKESAENTIRNLAGWMVQAERPTGDKTLRADPFSVQVNNGNVLLRTAVWNKSYMDEFELFPNSSYKDQVDASSGAFNFLIKKKRVRRIT